MRRNIKGQSILEYAVLIFVIIGALVAMQIYMRRGLEGRMRQATDDVGKQFAPGNTTVNRYTTRTATIVEFTKDGKTETKMDGSEDSGSVAEETMSQVNEVVDAW